MSSSGEPIRIDDEIIDMLKTIPHVEVVSPVLSMNIIAKQGAYVCDYLPLRAMDVEALQKMNIEVAQGTLPAAGDTELKFFYGNTVLTNFYNEKTQEYYWENMVLPDVDLMNDPMFIIFDQDAYWQSQYGGYDGEVVKPPKKYLVEACGTMAGSVDDWGEYSDTVFCDVDLLKPYLQRVFRNKVIPGQPTTASGKPYKELFYNQAYVKVDDVKNMKDVQAAIQGFGLMASSNAEWIEQMEEQSKSIQLVLGGIGAVSMFVAAISIANTMMMSIYERTKEIGIFKVLGCALGNIRNLFLMEAGFIGFLGGIAGIILSYLISFIINHFATMSMGDYYSSLSYIPLWLVVLGMGFSAAVGMIAGLFPALRAMKLSPLAAIRNE